ncbi:MAG: hypothetical protein DI628_00245 [Blastochloris viridis]|uniref:Uncharacterized protein n=1 Tax=Blastochloris viridis TaxID=1079 RepID=A0A6N4R188_BLAVI|nr:MAG: hypothetical protein DI628_00245 [Blastochloris viridis]
MKRVDYHYWLSRTLLTTREIVSLCCGVAPDDPDGMGSGYIHPDDSRYFTDAIELGVDSNNLKCIGQNKFQPRDFCQWALRPEQANLNIDPMFKQEMAVLIGRADFVPDDQRKALLFKEYSVYYDRMKGSGKKITKVQIAEEFIATCLEDPNKRWLVAPRKGDKSKASVDAASLDRMYRDFRKIRRTK